MNNTITIEDHEKIIAKLNSDWHEILESAIREMKLKNPNTIHVVKTIIHKDVKDYPEQNRNL